MSATLALAPDAESATRVYYLPFAAQFLEDPAAFLAAEHSAWAAPLAWLYPALLGADPVSLRIAGLVLLAALAAFAFGTARRLHSARAGVAALAILAAGPIPWAIFPAALPEVPGLVALGAWIWALAESAPGRRLSWGIVAAAALGLALLALPALLPFTVAVVVVSAAIALQARGEPREAAAFLFGVHLAALALPLAAIARNAWLFDYPAIATGGGAALYHGHYLLTHGFDPAYFGLVTDAGLVTGEFSPRSIAGDRMLRAAALAAFADTPTAQLVELYATKLGAFLFVTPIEAAGSPEWLRSFRIAGIVLALWGALRAQRAEISLLLALLVVGQVAVHIPTAHSFRESVAALDLPLAILAAVGAADALAGWRRSAAAVALATTGIALGSAHAKLSPTLAPRIEDVPRLLAWSAERHPEGVTFGTLPGFRTSLSPSAERRDVLAAIRPAPRLTPWDSAILVADVRAAGTACRSFAVAFRRDGESGFGRELQRESAAPQAFAASALGLTSEGDLRLRFDCTPGARMRLEALWVAVPRFGLYYRLRALGQPPAADLLLPEGVRR